MLITAIQMFLIRDLQSKNAGELTLNHVQFIRATCWPAAALSDEMDSCRVWRHLNSQQ